MSRIDHEATDSVICPWCGHDNGDGDYESGSEIDCEQCGRAFDVEIDTIVVYTTSKLGEP